MCPGSRDGILVMDGTLPCKPGVAALRRTAALSADTIAGDCDVLRCVYRVDTFFRFPLERGLVCGGRSGFFRSSVVARVGGFAGLAGGTSGIRGDDLRLALRSRARAGLSSLPEVSCSLRQAGSD